MEHPCQIITFKYIGAFRTGVIGLCPKAEQTTVICSKKDLGSLTEWGICSMTKLYRWSTGCPRKKTLIKFSALDSLWYFGHLSTQIWTLLDCLDAFEHFWTVWTLLDTLDAVSKSVQTVQKCPKASKVSKSVQKCPKVSKVSKSVQTV